MSQKRRKCGFSSLGTFAAIGQRTSISLLPHRLEATPQLPLVATYSLQRFESLTRLPNVLRRADTQVTQGEYTNSSHVLVSRRLVYSVLSMQLSRGLTICQGEADDRSGRGRRVPGRIV